jgi:hypothetical protein
VRQTILPIWLTACAVFLRACRIFLPAILFVLAAAPAHAGDDNPYIQQLLSDARSKQLSEQRYWHLLVHYRLKHGSWQSTVTDPRFFLSQSGRHNPESELEATIRALFDHAENENDSCRCRFPARFAWLKEQLFIDETRLPSASCSDLTRTMGAVSPKSVALIFPVAYVNSPSSMFGHTLLRIDGNHDAVLVSQAVNYAAVTEQSKGLSFAWKGIFGGYHGYYSSVPYYEKVKEYSGIEHRDIWEYALDLTPEEARRIVLHAWEMREIYSDYYFFDENCSYEVLFLLEVARPSLHLTEAYDHSLKFWVIPGDTVKLVVDSGIVTDIRFRPSQATRIMRLAAVAAPDEQQTAYEIATGARTPDSQNGVAIDPARKANVYELSAEYVQYLASRRQMTEDQYKDRFIGVLKQRSALGLFASAADSPISPVRPENGHLPFRLGLGGGCRDGVCFGKLDARPAYHDLLDNDDGYVRGAAIDFMDAGIRYEPGAGRIELDHLRVLDIESLAARDRFFKPLSWKVNVGVERKLIQNGDEPMLAELNAGAGASYAVLGSIWYAMAEAELDAGRGLKNGGSFGVGGSAGVLGNVASWWKYQGEARAMSPVVGAPYRPARVSLDQNFTIRPNDAICAKVLREEANGFYKSEMTVLWNRYY